VNYLRSIGPFICKNDYAREISHDFPFTPHFTWWGSQAMSIGDRRHAAA
jgi:hypothetical protein